MLYGLRNHISWLGNLAAATALESNTPSTSHSCQEVYGVAVILSC
jgi:hypothetical protein